MSRWEQMFDSDGDTAFMWSAASLACACMQCCSYLCCSALRRTPGWLVYRATLCDVVSSLVLSLVFMTPTLDEEELNFVFRIVAAADVCGYALRAFVYVYLLSIYRNPFQPERHRHLFRPMACGFSVVSLVLLEMIAPDKPLDKLAVGLFIMPFVVFFVFGGAVHMTVRALVFMHRPGVDGGVAGSQFISSLARQRVCRHGTAYHALFGTPLALGIACTSAINCGSHSQALRSLTVFLALGRPVLYFVGWVAINDVVFKLFGVCSLKRQPEETHTPPPSKHSGRLSKSAELQMKSGIEEKGFKEELRFELLYNVARGLGELAREELHDEGLLRRATIGASGTSSSFHLELVPRRETVSDLAADAELGRTASWDAADAVDGEAPAAPAEEEMGRRSTAKSLRANSMQIPPSTTLLPMAPERSSKPRSFAVSVEPEHYAKERFRSIRDAFGISRSSFAASFPNDLTELSSDWRAKLKESVSEGVSGCFFYRVLAPAAGGSTQLSKFIVKQITEPEKNTLMKMLPAYQAHVESRRGRSFICYYGCHAMPLNWTFSRKVYFVVMRNFLPAKMWLAFDLKGATANRRSIDEQTLFKKGTASDLRCGTLRDWEWLDTAMVAEVSAKDKAELAGIICEDATFLGEQGLLDYSLLLGIYRFPKEVYGDKRQAQLEELKRAGGYVSRDRQKVYFFGIIDVLERYSLRWRAQHAVLKAGYCVLLRGPESDGISAMPPAAYAERFRTFVLREVLQVDLASPLCRSIGPEAEQQEAAERRWAQLWKSRRRGLVRERIEAQVQDHVRSIEELHRQGARWARHIDALEAELRRRGLEPPCALGDADRLAVRAAATAAQRKQGCRDEALPSCASAPAIDCRSLSSPLASPTPSFPSARRPASPVSEEGRSRRRVVQIAGGLANEAG